MHFVTKRAANNFAFGIYPTNFNKLQCGALSTFYAGGFVDRLAITWS